MADASEQYRTAMETELAILIENQDACFRELSTTLRKQVAGTDEYKNTKAAIAGVAALGTALSKYKPILEKGPGQTQEQNIAFSSAVLSVAGASCMALAPLGPVAVGVGVGLTMVAGIMSIFTGSAKAMGLQEVVQSGFENLSHQMDDNFDKINRKLDKMEKEIVDIIKREIAEEAIRTVYDEVRAQTDNCLVSLKTLSDTSHTVRTDMRRAIVTDSRHTKIMVVKHKCEAQLHFQGHLYTEVKRQADHFHEQVHSKWGWEAGQPEPPRVAWLTFADIEVLPKPGMKWESAQAEDRAFVDWATNGEDRLDVLELKYSAVKPLIYAGLQLMMTDFRAFHVLILDTLGTPTSEDDMGPAEKRLTAKGYASIALHRVESYVSWLETLPDDVKNIVLEEVKKHRDDFAKMSNW